MPGRRVDRAVLGAGWAVACYLYFLNAWNSIPLACGAAFACCVLTRRLLGGLRVRGRATIAQARAELLRLAGLDDGEAEAALTALVQRRYPRESFRLAPVLKHPEATMTSGDVLNAWKANRDAERLVIASTCPCEPRAAFYAGGLRDPDVAVMDSRRLIRLLRACPAEDLPPAPDMSLRVRLKRLISRIGAARASPRNGLLAAALLASYWIGSNPWCLFSALALLLHLGVALIRRGTGRRLFEAK